MDNGPSGNLRKTPGRIASHCERLTQYVDTPCATKHTRKSTRKRRSTGKLSKSKRKDKKGRQPTVDSFIKPTKVVSKYLLKQFNESVETETRLSVLERVKNFESGYSTDPEVELRKISIGVQDGGVNQ